MDGRQFFEVAGPLTLADLPVASHELIALCAPRPVFIGSGATNRDSWDDAKGMLLAAARTGPVYGLLRKKRWERTGFRRSKRQ